MRALALAPVVVVTVVLTGCSTNVTDIRAESTGASSAGGHSTQGAGGGSATAAGSTTGVGGSGAGSCCSEPVHVAGQVKTLTADTDAAQLVTAQETTNKKVLDGPFVLTDAFNDSVYLGGPDCTSLVQIDGGHGLHIYIPPGSTLCHDVGNRVVVSGYRPY